MDTQQQQSVRTIGKYRVLGTLGRGSMGVVYRAEDPEIGRSVAVKVLRKVIGGSNPLSDAALKRFRNEARSAGNLRHPHIITVFEVNSEADPPFIVMDFIEGDPLDQIITGSGRLDPARALLVLAQVAAGLDYAHSKGVVHRDIKPSNVLIDKLGNACILDFGVASISGASAETGEAVMGTPGYMAPEQITNDVVDFRADLFGFGVLAFECLSGQRPFVGSNFTTVVGNILAGKRLQLQEVCPDLPLALDAEFERALARKKEDRFQDARSMIEAFAKALGQETPQVAAGEQKALVRKRKMSEWKPFTLKSKAGEAMAQGEADEAGEASTGERRARPRFDTKKYFSPWRIEQRRNDPRQASSNTPAISGSTQLVGGRMFGGLNESVGGAMGMPLPQEEEPNSAIRLMILALGLSCLLLAGGVVWLLSKKAGDGDAAFVPLPSSDRGNDTTQVVPVGPDGAPLSMPKPDPVPVGKAIPEMSDKELLGVLMSPKSQETQLIQALREARNRSISGLVEASVYPMQNDSYIVRLETIKMLAEIGDKRIVPQMLLRLDDHDPIVRAETARALGTLADSRALGYLSARLIREDDDKVRAAIKNAVDKINGYASP